MECIGLRQLKACQALNKGRFTTFLERALIVVTFWILQTELLEIEARLAIVHKIARSWKISRIQRQIQGLDRQPSWVYNNMVIAAVSHVKMPRRKGISKQLLTT